MLRRVLSSIAVVALATSAMAADNSASGKATNTICICGKAVGSDPRYVTVRDGDHVVTFAVCSERCMTRVKAMDPKEAIKAFENLNKTK